MSEKETEIRPAPGAQILNPPPPPPMPDALIQEIINQCSPISSPSSSLQSSNETDNGVTTENGTTQGNQAKIAISSAGENVDIQERIALTDKYKCLRRKKSNAPIRDPRLRVNESFQIEQHVLQWLYHPHSYVITCFSTIVPPYSGSYPFIQPNLSHYSNVNSNVVQLQQQPQPRDKTYRDYKARIYEKKIDYLHHKDEDAADQIRREKWMKIAQEAATVAMLPANTDGQAKSKSEHCTTSNENALPASIYSLKIPKLVKPTSGKGFDTIIPLRTNHLLRELNSGHYRNVKFCVDQTKQQPQKESNGDYWRRKALKNAEQNRRTQNAPSPTSPTAVTTAIDGHAVDESKQERIKSSIYSFKIPKMTKPASMERPRTNYLFRQPNSNHNPNVNIHMGQSQTYREHRLRKVIEGAEQRRRAQETAAVAAAATDCQLIVDGDSQ